MFGVFGCFGGFGGQQDYFFVVVGVFGLLFGVCGYKFFNGQVVVFVGLCYDMGGLWFFCQCVIYCCVEFFVIDDSVDVFVGNYFGQCWIGEGGVE